MKSNRKDISLNSAKFARNGDRELSVELPSLSRISNGSDAVFPGLSVRRVKHLIGEATQSKVIVLGDIMLDEFVWGSVRRISPEAPVPVVHLERESFMPGGAANVARNLGALKIPTELFSIIGKDEAGKKLKDLLSEANVGADGCLQSTNSVTTVKTRIIAHQQQVVRLDRERVQPPDQRAVSRLMRLVKEKLATADALIIGDYGKGIVTQALLDWLKETCRAYGVWLSMDPKPAHTLDLSGVSLLTPNRKEAFELAGVTETAGCTDPLKDRELLGVAQSLLASLQPGVLLITLGERGMLLCENGKQCVHIPTVAKQVFDVSGAGDTVIATFTAAISAGASPTEAAILANCAAGVVVGKVGTATASAQELLRNVVACNGELTPRYGTSLGRHTRVNGHAVAVKA
ncbi:MAG: carbohydrate kinase [Verrucomicrobia bacterium]|nr:carbohydrate kinase [Verrucomicrobiota bacterium]